MKFASSEISRDKRIAVAAFLRDSDGQNRERLAHIHSILSGQPYLTKEITSESMQSQPVDPEEKAFWRSFRIRCAIALLLTIGVYIGIMTGSPKITPYINKIKSEIATDYSENLFDFLQQIPYTLDYEKINA